MELTESKVRSKTKEREADVHTGAMNVDFNIIIHYSIHLFVCLSWLCVLVRLLTHLLTDLRSFYAYIFIYKFGVGGLIELAGILFFSIRIVVITIILYYIFVCILNPFSISLTLCVIVTFI